MMNGEVESSNGTVTDLPSEVVEKSNKEELVSATHEEEESSHEEASATPDDQMLENGSVKEEIADVDAMNAGGESQDEVSAGGSEIPLNSAEDRLPEDVFRKSVELDVLEELRNGHPEAQSEEVEILDSCSSGLPNGAHEVLEEESGDVDPVPITGTSQTEEATGGAEVPLEIENDGLQEDTSLQSVASNVTEKLSNGHPEVEIGESESRSIESGDGNAVAASSCPDGESAGGSEIPLDAAAEDVSLPSATLDITEELPNGHSQVEDEKVDILDSPKTALPILSGWAQAVMKGRLQNVEIVPTAVTPQIEESIRGPEVLEIPEKDLLLEDIFPQSVAPGGTKELPSGIEEVEKKEFESPEDTCNSEPQNGPTFSSSPETANEQIDMGDSPTANESAGGLEVSLHPEDEKLPEDVSPQSVAAEKTAELPHAHIEVEIRKPDISDGWNSGSTSGWASADPPGEESSSVPEEVGVSTSGVLGSAPAPVDAGTEQTTLQRYTYYMIKIPRPVDDKGKADISNAESKLQEKADERDQHNLHVQAVKKKRIEALEKLKAAGAFERECLQKLRAKYDEVKPLRDSIKSIKGDERNMRERNQGMPRSEEDLNFRISTLEKRIQHETISLKEEKQLMRDIKALESCRESVRQNAALKQQVQESMGNQEEIEEALKPLNAEYKQLEVEYKAAVVNKVAAEKEYDTQNEALSSVMGQMHKANDSRQEAYEARRVLKQQEYVRLKEFYDNKREIQTAKDMASQPKSRQAVEEFCNAQMERIMELWNSNEEFRKSYVKDNERSTIRRLETLDGRALGPGEKAPTLSVPSRVAEQRSSPSATESGRQGGNTGGEGAEEAGVKKVKAPVKKESETVVATKSTEKTVSKEERRKESSAVAVVAEPIVVEKSREEIEREAAELKEKRRAAEMAKAKEAEERKKRTAERSQLKAQVWAQKEAERKEKEKEKKSRKKSATVSPVEAVNLSESVPDAEGNKSGPEVEEPVVEQTSVNVRRKRGVTVSQKTVTKALVESPSLARVRRKSQQQKVFGLPLQTVVVMGSAAAVVLVPISIFLFR